MCRVSEQAKYVDSRYGVKRRLRNLSDDVQRKWPTVSLSARGHLPHSQLCPFLGTILFGWITSSESYLDEASVDFSLFSVTI